MCFATDLLTSPAVLASKLLFLLQFCHICYTSHICFSFATCASILPHLLQNWPFCFRTGQFSFKNGPSTIRNRHFEPSTLTKHPGLGHFLPSFVLATVSISCVGSPLPKFEPA